MQKLISVDDLKFSIEKKILPSGFQYYVVQAENFFDTNKTAEIFINISVDDELEFADDSVFEKILKDSNIDVNNEFVKDYIDEFTDKIFEFIDTYFEDI